MMESIEKDHDHDHMVVLSLSTRHFTDLSSSTALLPKWLGMYLFVCWP